MPTPDPGREPISPPPRPTAMRRLATTLAALTLTLAACGGDTGEDDVATDPQTTASPSPSPSPTVGTYPGFEPTDYTYTLTVSCYCPGAGTPIAVTVEGDEVVDAVYGDGELAGQQAAEPFRLTIDDVIAATNDTEADEVRVDWPTGQDFPTSVYVDSDFQAADEERGYEVADVVVG